MRYTNWFHVSILFFFFFCCMISAKTREGHRHRYRHYYPEESEEGSQVDCHHEFRISLQNPMVVIQSSLLPHPFHPQKESCSIDVSSKSYLGSKYKISYYLNRLIFHSNDAFIRIKNGRKSQTVDRYRGSFIHNKHESIITVHPNNETLIVIELSDGFLSHNNTFEMVFTAFTENYDLGTSCPRDYFDCGFERRCIPKQLRCNGWNNCRNHQDESNCYTTRVPEQKSATILSILIRLCIFLLIGIFLRLTCIFCGCCKGGFRFPWRGREEEDSASQTAPSSGTHSVAGSLTRERGSFNDTPPPYPGTPVSRIVRTLLGSKSETPPPSYKQAVKFKHDSPNMDDVSSKESA